MVHSSMDRLARRVPGMTPVGVIRLMQDLLGPGGTLLMPTFPFLGSQLEYVKSQGVFHPQKTPSQVGLITEIFRRMPGVSRSLHPSHPVAAWGKYARELTASHHLGTAFGENSPLFQLQHYGGLVLGLGAGFQRFTIFHVPEELHPKTREFAFESTPRLMTIVRGDTEIPYQLFAMRSGIIRNYDRIERILLRDGTLRAVERSGLKCVVARAEDLIRRSLELIDRDSYLFDC
jgi:aminoglycoside 3-N-acetyltransferase